MRISIMQPYFLPYAGYFRLPAASDLFVLYDCVQFPRRSYVHRNRLRLTNQTLEWLTLPLKKAPQNTRIDSLGFAFGREQEWHETLCHFPAFTSSRLFENGFSAQVKALDGTPVDYIERLLNTVCTLLAIPFHTVRSSTLNLPENLRGQDRILAICEYFNAKTYINSPGGRDLYDAASFEKHGIALRFLSDYQGDMASIAQILADYNGSSKKLGEFITAQCTCL